MAEDARETDSPADRAGEPLPRATEPADGSAAVGCAADGSAADGPGVDDVAGPVAPEDGGSNPDADPDADHEDAGRLDPQLIGLAVVLWLLAVGIFAFKWDRLRVDWYLGNIKETGELAARLDEGSIEALAALAVADAEVLRMVGDEVVGPLANGDEFYRSAIVKTIERVPGPAAQALLLAAAIDFHGVVRANSYVSLGVRARADASERAQTAQVLLGAVGSPGDPEPMSRAVALSVLQRLEVKEAVWPAIRAVREARGAFTRGDPEAMTAGELAVREAGASAFYALSGQTPEALPFDPAADLPARDEQVRAWERWFVAAGGVIPEGEAFDEVHPPAPDDAQGPPAPDRDGQSTEAAPPAGSSPEDQQGSQ